MVFRCQQCGECCRYMGDIIEIEEQTGPGTYRIRFPVTGEERTVTLDPDKADLFSSQDSTRSHPMACPFLRFRDKRAFCTVHATRPGLCRQYGCFRVLILDNSGRHLGRVRDGSRTFSSLDPALHELWDTEVTGTDILDEAAWERWVRDVFSRAGYRVVI
ncbi:YkgJ family cysteine cluster protein [Methanoregula sp. UBA64]|uniref:YkgJ family cysteine cluster protein n=1 Tax=Methanoregula sp. UBA64 TaxID=1915554 RepID=UPI0026008FA9|nr:YkgJ family cysteine cluster protein [Methanoregula sp. UBA64]